jgi:biopolymer transport protein ExbD
MAVRLATRVLPRRRISLTPLIDVVFILLVFFMLETTFLREGGVSVAGLEDGVSTVPPAEKLTIELLDVNSVWVNGRRFGVEEWQGTLIEYRGRAGLPVEVRSSKGVPVQRMVDVLDTLARYELERVSLGRAKRFGS